MSLKSNLNQIIKDRNGGIVSINEIETYCHKAKYKLSNAERRLRKSESPDIEPVYNDKKTAIIGYKARTEQKSAITDVCCPSYGIFGTHNPNCAVMEDLERKAKIIENHEEHPTLFKLDKSILR